MRWDDQKSPCLCEGVAGQRPKGGAPKGGAPKISRFVSSSPQLFFFHPSLRGLLVEFWWCLKRRGNQKHRQNSTRRPRREGRKNENCGGRGKKSEILGRPAEGGSRDGVLGEGGGAAEGGSGGGGKIELAKVGIRQSRAGQNGPQSQGSGFRVSGLGFSFHGVRLFRDQGGGREIWMKPILG